MKHEVRTVTLEDGCVFTGTFDTYGLRQGEGCKTYTNGATFVGEYKDNVRHGPGIKTTANGTIKNVVYVNGKLEPTPFAG